jgi:delta 1-pyrroline-5-carboxylate dehydrogenase
VAAGFAGQLFRIAVEVAGALDQVAAAPWNSIAAIFSGEVVAGITAMNGRPSRRAK